MSPQKTLQHHLLEVSQLKNRLNLLEEQVAALESSITLIEASKAYRLKILLTKITKRLRIYYPLLVTKFHLKQSVRQMLNQLKHGSLLMALFGFLKFNLSHTVTFAKLFLRNHDLFLLYVTNSFASLNSLNLKVEATKNKINTARVDIVIPWYGDSNIVKLMLSLKTFDRSFVNRIYLINDAYPNQEKTQIFLQQLKQLNFEKLKIITNSFNLGFIGTVNRGMRLAKYDVVLLNSDTIPTNNWIDELRAACYADKKNATATALSNNATIFSLQRFNKASADYSPGETARALAAVSPVSTVTVPTAHGFCMYIRRSILKKYGYFDQKRYGKGYCEENDFSMRLHKAGYNNVAATKSYVAHLEGRSFGSKQRQTQIKTNYQKLLQRYPEYNNYVDACLKTGELRDFQKSTSFLLTKWRQNKEYVLLINHSDVFTAVGGVERTTFAEISRLTRAGNRNILLYFFDDQQRVFKLLFIEGNVIKSTVTFAASSTNAALFSWIISSFPIKLAIINHLMHHSFDYFKLLKQQKIKSMLFVHDYYYLFGTPDLLSLAEFTKPMSVKILTRKSKKLLAAQLSAVDKIIFNSEFTKAIHERFLGKLPNSLISYPDQLLK